MQSLQLNWNLLEFYWHFIKFIGFVEILLKFVINLLEFDWKYFKFNGWHCMQNSYERVNDLAVTKKSVRFIVNREF